MIGQNPVQNAWLLFARTVFVKGVKMKNKKLYEQFQLIQKHVAFMKALRTFHEEFEKTCGFDYAAVDDDFLIDSIDYGNGFTWGEFKAYMKRKYQCDL